jgi:hypothetical protein
MTCDVPRVRPYFSRLRTLGLATLACAVGCAVDGAEGGGAAHPGVDVTVTQVQVAIDDELETSVRVFLELDHLGGPTAETFSVVEAHLARDLEAFSPIELAIPSDHPPFAGLADGELLEVELRGSVPLTHDDWGLCLAGPDEAVDEERVTLHLELRITPGANDDADDFVFESQSVTLNCVYIG